MWGLKEEWDQKYRSNIRDIKFKDIDTNNLMEYADDYTYKLNDLSKENHIRKWGIYTSIKASI